MSFLRRKNQVDENSSATAKERLQIVVSHQRVANQDSTILKNPEYMKSLQKDILAVVKKYVNIEKPDIKIDVDNKDGMSVLEVNVSLPDRPL